MDASADLADKSYLRMVELRIQFVILKTMASALNKSKIVLRNSRNCIGVSYSMTFHSG